MIFHNFFVYFKELLNLHCMIIIGGDKVEKGVLKNRLDVAIHLLKENVSLDIISRVTDFSQEFLHSTINILNINYVFS